MEQVEYRRNMSNLDSENSEDIGRDNKKLCTINEESSINSISHNPRSS
jgi:hypothetical protein